MTEVLSPAPPTEAMDRLSLENQQTSPATSSSHEPLTVFHDPKNFNVKHPLMHTWTLWFTKTPSATGPKEHWADLLKEVITFDSVEEFWGYSGNPVYVANIRIFNNISKTSEIPLKSDYALFKKGVRPEWEDNANEKGGKWSYQFKRNVNIDELWLYTVSSDPENYLTDRCSQLSAKHLKRKEMMKLWESLSTQGKDSTELDCGLNPVPIKKY
jgi:translation initiation factor 4E